MSSCRTHIRRAADGRAPPTRTTGRVYRPRRLTRSHDRTLYANARQRARRKSTKSTVPTSAFAHRLSLLRAPPPPPCHCSRPPDAPRTHAHAAAGGGGALICLMWGCRARRVPGRGGRGFAAQARRKRREKVSDGKRWQDIARDGVRGHERARAVRQGDQVTEGEIRLATRRLTCTRASSSCLEIRSAAAPLRRSAPPAAAPACPSDELPAAPADGRA